MTNNGGGDNAGGIGIAVDDHWIYQAEQGGGVQIKNLGDHSDASVSLTGSSTLAGSIGIYGMTISKGKLYVTEDDVNVVDVFDTTTLALVESFSINDPVRIAVDCRGDMWISHLDHTPPTLNTVNHGFGTAVIDKYESKGNWKTSITLPEGGEVGSLWIDRTGLLYVGDDGPDQNVKIYANIENAPYLAATFGVKGGVYAAGSERGKREPLHFHGITGVATDDWGNIYVSQNSFGFTGVDSSHGAVLESYAWYGGLNWSVQGLEFIENADLDPGDETSMYDPYHRYKMDYSKPPGQQWKFVSDTVDPVRYPEDFRLTSSGNYTQVQRIQGKKFLFVGGQYGNFLTVYRFRSGDSKEIAIPCGAFNYGGQLLAVNPPNAAEYIWRDLNGDGLITQDEFLQPPNPTPQYGTGWWVDSKGDVWQVISTWPNPGLRRYLFQGFDQFGAPIWDYQHVESYPFPAEFASNNIWEAIFVPGGSAGGSLYLVGNQYYPPLISQWTGQFTQIARYDGWDLGNRAPAWTSSLPIYQDLNPNDAWNPQNWSPNSFAVAGNFVFVDFATPHYIAAFEAGTGQYVGQFVPGNDVGGPVNLGNSDMNQAMNAHRLSDGQYIVLNEDDFQSKIVVYQWTPPSELPSYGNPAPPTSVKAAPDDEAAILTWNLSKGALSTFVYEGSTSGGPYTLVKAAVPGAGVTVPGISNIQPTYFVTASMAQSGHYSTKYSPEVKIQGLPAGTTYEAENAVLNGEGVYPGAEDSGGLYVGDLNSGATITFPNVSVSTAGTYAVRIYGSTWDNPAWAVVNVSANAGATIASPPIPYTGDPSIPSYVVVNLSLNAGTNTIELAVPPSQGSQQYAIDRIVVPFAPQ